jgi:ABC-type transport system involved in Fe-S cluster assembly fused permease/ATPase subunit
MAGDTEDTAKGRDLHALRALVPLIWERAEPGLRVRLLTAMLLTWATAGLNAAAPVLFKQLVDRLTASAALLPALLLGAYIALQCLAFIVGELRWFLYGKVEQHVQRQLTLLLFDHVHALSLRFHLGRHTGGLQQTIGNGLMGYRLVLFNALFVVVPLIVELALVGIVLAGFYEPVFVGVVAVTTALYVVSFVIGVERQRTALRETTSAYTEAFAKAADSYLNYETIKYFGAESHVRGFFDRSLALGEAKGTLFYNIRSVTGLIQALILTCGLGAVVVAASRAVAGGSMTVGDFVLVNAYMLQLIRPLGVLSFAYREVKMGLTYVEKMTALLDERSEIVEAPAARVLPDGKGELVFSDVCFAYDERRPVLDGVSFRVAPGRTLAVVGASGAGKSTLSRLIFRFYDLTGGTIAIDGASLSEVTLASLRAAIAVVPQDTALFNDTLEHNIAIGRPAASRGEIEDAARLAEIHDFIATLPDGYETVVGERGLKLSGGEKQRVAIARAVLKHPRIFIFDEATSALDSHTERAIQRNLETVSRGTTTLIIAHRLSTVVHADEIIVLDNGRVAERGRHAALLEEGGLYAAMWRRQQRGHHAGEDVADVDIGDGDFAGKDPSYA